MATDTICGNDECGKDIIRKNSKQVYCSLTCKNRDNYLKNLKKNARDIVWNKGYENNKKILIDLYSRDKLIVPIDALDLMGFNFKCLKEKLFKGEELTYYIIGDFFLINETENKLKIEPINK